MWNCAAIDHGITIFPTGKIGPCCQISADYLKPISLLKSPDRFSDLKTESPPAACSKCVKSEHSGIPSYRQFFNTHTIKKDQNIVFLDIRNTNQCNLKCRYCGPHFSNQWAKELNFQSPLQHTDISDIFKDILTADLQLIYFTGGEPFISADHWKILQYLIDSGISQNIKLVYNTNLTTLKYKDVDFFDVWSKFSKINIMASIDSVDETFNFIRSGAKWNEVEDNLHKIIQNKNHVNLELSVACVISILNIWNLVPYIEYFQQLGIPIKFNLLEGPDYLSLNVIPDQLKDQALKILDHVLLTVNDPVIQEGRNSVVNNQNQVLFKQCLSHVLLLDSIRNENLFGQLPFKNLAKELIANNHEYE